MAALASLMLLIPLSGCSGDEYVGMQGADCVDIGGAVTQCTVTMTDTRRVTCLVFSPKTGGGIDCDWTHASGNDVM